MGQKHRPRRGSMQYWPRKRARKETPRLRNWFDNGETFLGFAGYKAGMTQLQVKDNHPKYGKSGEIVTHPVTVIECPPLKPLALRFYKRGEDGLKVSGYAYSSTVNKEITRKLKLPKNTDKLPETWDEVRLIVHTQPKLAGFGKKKPEVFEMPVKQSNIEELKNLLTKDITIKGIFKEGEYLDSHAVTKGKGYQGAVKRFGVTIRQKKSEKTKRGVGNLGPWTPKRVSYRVPQAGQMGYHLRTEFNKQLLYVGEKPEDINPKGGFIRYGLVKNAFLLIAGSLPGPKKRLIILTHGRRTIKKQTTPSVISINKESKQ
ncbi:MAG: 50S ribosomal protein L3 [Nanoarchaeota archaeon]